MTGKSEVIAVYRKIELDAIKAVNRSTGYLILYKPKL